MANDHGQKSVVDLNQLSIAQQQAIEKVCDQFEAEWNRGATPDPGEHAESLDREIRAAGLCELVILDASYRRKRSGLETPGGLESCTRVANAEPESHHGPASELAVLHWADYVRRFPILAGIQRPDEFLAEAGPSVSSRFQTICAHASGGLGRVNIARDLQIGRNVAIKEMHKRFIRQPSFRQRFMREAEITGRLEHPSIVPVYAMCGGDDETPWYAMRLIEGRSMLEAIRALHATHPAGKDSWVRCRDLLSRFVDVCQAVNYAHSRGVIHRDIKPQNVVVGDYGETLLVDWGLAKKMGDQEPAAEAETESFIERQPGSDEMDGGTRQGTVLGTPGYMSPEQAGGLHDQVDPRSDIYSLGATLLHLVTGRPPTRNSRDAVGSNSTVALGRFRKPLLAICHRAMADDPAARHESAQQLAEEIELALADQKVPSYAEPATARISRWLRNHQAFAFASLVAAVLVIVALVALSWMTKTHSDQLLVKNRQLDQLVQQETRLRVQAEEAEQLTEDSMNYLVSALRSPDPNRDGREIKVVEILDQAASQLSTDFGNNPVALARMSLTLARTYHGLGLAEQALPLSERARNIYVQQLGPDHRLTLRARYHLALVYDSLDDQRATELMNDVANRCRDLFGESDPDTLDAQSRAAIFRSAAGEAGQAVEILRALQPRYEQRYAKDSDPMLSFMNDLANAYHHNGQFNEAIELSRYVYQRRRESLGEGALKTIVNASNYVGHLMNSPQRPEAVNVLEELLPVARKSLGDDHPQTLVNMNRLGVCYGDVNEMDRAIDLIEEALERRSRLYGPDHKSTLVSANSLGVAFLNSGRFQEATVQLQRVYDNSVKIRGPAHRETLTFANNLATAYRLNGQYEDAIQMFRETLDAQVDSLGKHHLYTIRTMLNLASTYQDNSQIEDSQAIILEANRLASQHLGTDHPITQTTMSIAGTGYLLQNDLHQAREMFRTCLDARVRTMPEHWLRFHTMSLLGEVHHRCGDSDAAEKLLVSGYEGMVARKESILTRALHRLDEARDRLVKFYEESGNPDKAAKYRD